MASQYIGGDLTQNEREPYMRRLRGLPVQNAEWPYQCRCGTYGFVTYRGRNYCPRCGHRFAAEGLAVLESLHS